MPECKKNNIFGTTFCADGLTNMSDGRYSKTATGELGVHRRSMLYNPLLLNHMELGKSKCRGYNKKFKGNSVTYGKTEQKDAEAIYAVFDWNVLPLTTNSKKQGVVPKVDKNVRSLDRDETLKSRHSTSRNGISLKDIMEYKFHREWMEKRLNERQVSDDKIHPNVYRDTVTSSMRYQLASSSSSSTSPSRFNEDKKHIWKMSKFENVRPRVQTCLRSGD